MKGTSQEEHNVFRFKFHLGFVLMRLNATFNNISVLSRRSVVLVGETGENHWQVLFHNVVSSTLRHEQGSNSHLQGKFEKILKDLFTIRLFFKKYRYFK